MDKSKPTQAADKLKEITNQLEKGIQDLFSSKKYADYLKTMATFYHYSLNNSLLIHMQRPDSSLVAGYGAWQKNFKRQVKRGEHGIKILAPTPYTIHKNLPVLDPATRQPVLDATGQPVTEQTAITIPTFKVVSVFDVSQTDGQELPTIAVAALTGEVTQYQAFFAALESASPVPIAFEAIASGAKGYYHQIEKRIALLEGMSQLQTLKTLIHEIAHAKLHDLDAHASNAAQRDLPDRHTREVQAESVAYTVCQQYGLDTADYSFGYIAGWSSGKELAELKSSLETIRSTAATLIGAVDGYMLEQQREQLCVALLPVPDSPPRHSLQSKLEQSKERLEKQQAPIQSKRKTKSIER